MSDNASSAVNQQGSLHQLVDDPSETTRRPPVGVNREEILAYLQGAMHDASLNKGKRIRFAQKYREWLIILQRLLESIGARSWIYKEGKNRNLYVLETVCKDLDFNFDPGTLNSKAQKISYIRGFFDAEGGMPKNGKRFYVQLVQKNKAKIELLKMFLSELGIKSGKIHNPSRRVDPDYWRVFIAADGHKEFARFIGSYHSVKEEIFRKRMMI